MALEPPWAVLLADGKPGHENQSLGVLPEGLSPWRFEVRYRSRVARTRAWLAARFFPALAGVFPWAGLLHDADQLAGQLAQLPAPRVVISSGSGPAPINLLLARHLNIPAVTCMTPSVGTAAFHLALVPRHDHPPVADNIVQTLGAPNRIDPDQLAQQGREFRLRHGLTGTRFIALLLGGDAPRFRIAPPLGLAILEGCITLAQQAGAELLVTTSRRTDAATENALAERADSAPECVYFCRGRTDSEVVVPGMLGLAELAVVTEDSVSMVSEAASSHARVLSVAPTPHGTKASRRHQAVLNSLAADGYLVRAQAGDGLVRAGLDLFTVPQPPVLADSYHARRAVAKLLNTSVRR